MSDTPLTPLERRQLVEKYWDTIRQLSWPHVDSLSEAQAKELIALRDGVLAEYAERLPRVPVSACPLCATVLEYAIDTLGFDGPWWSKGDLVDYAPPRGCPHFRVLLGAIDLHDRVPEEAAVHMEVYPGPGSPFVVPRLLGLPGMAAVVSSLMFPSGDTAFPVAYFSEKPFHGALLHQPWGREAYRVFDENGKPEGWSVATDPLDFQLAPWIERGLLSWIHPGDGSFSLERQLPCPYDGAGGVRAPQRIEQGVVRWLPLPGGEPVEPFETESDEK